MVTAPSGSEVVSAWHGIMHRDQLGGSGGKARCDPQRVQGRRSTSPAAGFCYRNTSG